MFGNQYWVLHWNLNWDITIQYGKDEARHAQALQEVNSKPQSTDLTHEDTVTIKDLDDAYAAATDKLIAELSEETAFILDSTLLALFKKRCCYVKFELFFINYGTKLKF